MDLIKVDRKVESIFAQAVGLSQSGRMKSTIFCKDRFVYILNGDNTILIRFELDSSQQPFAYPISFKASDYDSDQFYLENDRIVFVQKGMELEKKKYCGTPSVTLEEVENIWGRMTKGFISLGKVTVQKDSLFFFDEAMSHIELGHKGNYFFVQRDIFSGTIIHMDKLKPKGFGLSGSDSGEDFEPVGIRTSDFISLFTFASKLEFIPSKNDAGYVLFNNGTKYLSGIIACCLFDDLGTINYLGGSDGRGKVKENGTSKQEVDRPIGLIKKRGCRK